VSSLDDHARRAWHYAECTVLLQDDPEIAGAGALFDDALSNGLAAIVSHEWPGSEAGRRVGVKSARDLLGIVRASAAGEQGVHRLRGSNNDQPYEVEVRVRVLEDGLNHAQPVRHGRAGRSGGLNDAHVEALLALDAHPVLGKLDDARFDARWRREHHADWEAIERAQLYMSVLTDGEINRRGQPDCLADYVPFDLKERSAAEDPQLCPACSSEALIVSTVDYFGEGIGAGTCVVCGYSRSEFIADDIGQTEHINRLASEDD
jgi:hypothetical protein